MLGKGRKNILLLPGFLAEHQESPASPAITALDCNPGLLAEKACETLLQILGGDVKIEWEVLVPVSLVQRDSTR